MNLREWYSTEQGKKTAAEKGIKLSESAPTKKMTLKEFYQSDEGQKALRRQNMYGTLYNAHVSKDAKNGTLSRETHSLAGKVFTPERNPFVPSYGLAKMKAETSSELAERQAEVAAEREKVLSYNSTAGQAEIDNLEKIYSRATELAGNIRDNQNWIDNYNAGVYEGQYENREMLDNEYSRRKAAYDSETAEYDKLTSQYENGHLGVKSSLESKKAYHESALQMKGQFVRDRELSITSSAAKMDPEFAKYAEEGANFENPAPESDMSAPEDVVNVITFYRYWGGKSPNGVDYSLATDDEVDIYNYLLAKKGKKSADRYLSLLEETLIQREVANKAGKYNDTFAEPFYNFGAGVEKFGTNVTTGVWNLITGNEEAIEPSVRQRVSGQMMSDNEGVWKITNELANTAGNMIPSIGASVVASIIVPGSGAAVGSTLMGLSSAGGAYDEMIQMGYNANQARCYGLLVGAAEGSLQYLLGGIKPLGGSAASKIGSAFTKIAPKLSQSINKAFTAIAKNHSYLLVVKEIGKEMASEAIEEALQTALDPIFKKIATGEDFEGINLDEVLYSALLGALSGGTFEAAGHPVATAKMVGGIAKDTYNFVMGKPAEVYLTKQLMGANAPTFINGVTQNDIDNYVDAAYENSNDQAYKKYAAVSDRLAEDVGDEIDINGYSHALRDNDIRHIRNSHGEQTNEKYPVTKDDIKRIPEIVENYDKVFVSQKGNKTGIVYVKVSSDGLVYYLEQVTSNYGNENLLINKQMIKTGIGDIPDIPSIKTAITKKQSEIEFLNDLKKVQQVYVQDVSQSRSTPIIPQSADSVKGAAEEKLTEGMSEYAVTAMREGMEIVGEDKATDFAIGYRTAYQAGRIGMPVSSISADSVSALTEGQLEAAHALGAADAKAEKSQTDGNAESSVGSLDMFEDTEGILTDEELEAMHTYEKEDAAAGEAKMSEGDIRINPDSKRGELDPAELSRRISLAVKEKTDTGRSGRMEGVSEKNIRIAEFLSKVFGRKVLFISDSYRVRGKTKNGIIYVNAKWGNVAVRILAHELTHTAEGAKQYTQLMSAVKKLYAAEGKSWETMLDNMLADKTYQKQYESEGRVFDKPAAERELVARAVEEILGSEERLTQFAEDNRNIVMRFLAKVRNWVRGFGDAKLTDAEHEAAQLIRDVEKKLAKALRATKKDSKSSGRGVSYDLDESLGVQLQDWLDNGGSKGGKFNGVYFKLGTTPGVFIKHGAKKVEMIMYEDVVAKVTGMKGDSAHVISLDEISKLPSQLNDPILLFNGSVPNSFVALTELVDKQGHDVIVAVHISKGTDRSKITKIASMYSKTDKYGNNNIISYVNNQIKNGNLIDASTKKAPMWFTTRGLQLPKAVQTIIDANNSISQKSDSVNSEYSFATDEQLRRQAIKMLQDGVSAKQVYEETGFFTDDKGRIRNDVDDADSKDTNVISDRAALVETLKAGTTNPAVKSKLDEWAANIEKIEAEEEKLRSLKAQIKELSFAKGERDMAKLRALRDEATKTQNRISIYDKKLLNIEGMEPIKRLFESERKRTRDAVRHEYAERDAKRNMQREEAKRKARAERERRKRARGGSISIEKIREALENNTFVNEMEKLWEDLRKLEKEAEKYSKVNIEEASPELQEEIRTLRNAVEDKRVYIRKVGQQKRKVMRQKALELLRSGNIEVWADKKTLGGVRYSINTMLRNIEDISKGDELGKAVYKEYFAPISKHVAEATRLKNDTRAKVAALGLSTTVRKGDILSESAFVQLLGEARDNVYALENHIGYTNTYDGNKTRGGRTLADWQGVIDTLMLENPGISRDAEAMKRVNDAIETFKEIYDDLFKSLNKVRIYNGYAPIDYRHGYFPHFSSETATDSLWAELCDGLNFKLDTEDLPTTINGLTGRFRPGMQYQSFDKARSEHVGEQYNNIRLDGMGAVEGIDRYIEVAANVIYLTEDVQKLRALSEMIRYNASEDSIRERIDEIRKNNEMSEEEKQSMIESYLGSKPNTTLSNFVWYLEDYTNILAGKKSFWDRAAEQALGRGMYKAAKKIESRIAANMVAINPASWLTNFIPLTQVAAVTGNARMLLAASQTVKSAKNDDGFVSRSAFLTNRRGSDRLVRGKLRAVSDVLSSPMSLIDNFTAETVVRARYNENIANGMSESEAMAEADRFAAGLMGDRSLGAQPTVFSQSNPVTKLFTQYQLEVANQLMFAAKDLPRMYGDREKRKLAAVILKMALYGFLYNFLYKGLTGRDAAADPLGILNDVSGDAFGVALPDMRDFFDKGFTPELFKTQNYGQWKDTENWQEAAWKTVEVVVKSLGTASEGVLEQIPFTSALGLVLPDFDQGRLPISSAIPNIPDVAEVFTSFASSMAESASTGSKSAAYKKFIKGLYDELLVPASYILAPFGAGQAKKLTGAADALIKGGSYTYDNDGNRRLQYPVFTDEGFSTVGTAVKGLVFGKSSLGTAQEWVEGGFGSLSADATARYEELVKSGVSQREAYEAVAASSDSDALYEAVVSGDGNRLKIYKSAYKTDSAYKTALREGLRNNDSRIMEAITANIRGEVAKRTSIYKEILSEGNFELDIITSTVNNATTSFNKAIREAAAAKNAGNTAEYKKLVRKLVNEQGYPAELVTERIGENVGKILGEATEAVEVEKTSSLYQNGDIGIALDSGDTALAKEIISDLIKTAKENGKTESEARASVKSSVTSYYKDAYIAAYMAKDSAEMLRIRKAMYATKLYADVGETVGGWIKNSKKK